MLGIDQPITELTMMPYKGAKYSGGIAGGSGLKLAVNVPYRSSIRFPDESPTDIVELRFGVRFSTQPSNPKLFLG